MLGAGWYVAAQTYDAKGNLMYNSTLSSFQFANAATTNDQNAQSGRMEISGIFQSRCQPFSV